MPQAAGLSQLSISAALWSAFGLAVQLMFQFAIQVVLARLLGPEQYGLFAMALVLVSLSSFFSISFAYGLIQKRSVTDDDVRFVNFWQMFVGALVASTVFALGDAAAGFFQEPRVAPLMRAMSVVCLIQACAGPAANLLTRELDFKSIYLVGIASYAIGYGALGIPLAFAGYGVGALVIAFIAQNLLALGLYYWRKPHVLGFRIRHRDGGELCRYGFTVFATNVNNWALLHLSRVIVGRMFPSSAMGVYTVSYNLVMQLAGAVMGAVQPPLFSASSRVQDDLGRLRTAYLTMLAATALIAAPVFVCVAAVPESIMLALYGPHWADAAPLLRPFALAMPFYLATAMGTPMLWTSGRTTQEFKFQLPIAFALVLAAYFAAHRSLEAVAWAVLGIFLLRFIVIMMATRVALGLQRGDIATAFRAGIVVSAIVACTVALVDQLAVHVAREPLLVLAVDVAAGLIAQLAALRLFRPWFSREVLALFEMLLSRLPRRLAPLGQSILLVRGRDMTSGP